MKGDHLEQGEGSYPFPQGGTGRHWEALGGTGRHREARGGCFLRQNGYCKESDEVAGAGTEVKELHPRSMSKCAVTGGDQDLSGLLHVAFREEI